MSADSDSTAGSRPTWRELPPVVREIAASVTKEFRRAGEFEPSAFLSRDGDFKRVPMGAIFNDNRKKVEWFLIQAVKHGADTVAWCTEAWMVAAKMEHYVEAMTYARERRLEEHPQRIECLQLNCETATDRYLLTAEIKRDPVRVMPWQIHHNTRTELDAADLGCPVTVRFQGFFRKAGR